MMLSYFAVYGRNAGRMVGIIPCMVPEQRRTVYSKYAVPEYTKNKPEPWPYKERGYRGFHKLLDMGVYKRWDENSKIIVVEGNVGAGKSKLAGELAERLGFYHIPDPPFDDLFIDSYGDDRRLYYHLFPETCRDFDTRMFYEEPRHRNVAKFQHMRYMCRVEAYVNAIAHILNTGQGVVMERHYGADRAFVEAMYKKGYLSDAFRYNYYKFLMPNIRESIPLEPHLVIYLDCPVSRCLENIKKHHMPWEWKNEVMDYTYLEDMEKVLKEWLKEISRHAEIVSYDWSEGGDANAVAEDVEKLDLDSYDPFGSEKFETWYMIPSELHLAETRRLVTSDKITYLQYFWAKRPQVEELFKPVEDQQVQIAVQNMLYGNYASGYRAYRGDSVKDMVTMWFRDEVNNKPWNEYMIQDAHHRMEHDMLLCHPGVPDTPSFPDEFLQPRSPYKSDGGCMAHPHLFMDEYGQLVHRAH